MLYLFRNMLLSAICLSAVSCIGVDYLVDTSEVASDVMLELDVRVADLPGSMFSKASYAAPVNMGEKMQTLRVMIVRPDGIVEHNRFIDLAATPAMLYQDMVFEVVGDEVKDVWLLANEKNAKVDYDFAAVTAGMPFPSEDVNGLLLQLNSEDEQMPLPLPMSAFHKVYMPKKDMAEELYIVRAATKFTFLIRNEANADLLLSSIRISKAARKSWLFPHDAEFSDWNWTDEYGMWTGLDLTGYDVPTVGNNEYYHFMQEGYSLNIPAGGTSGNLGPFYLLEGRYTDAADARNYSVALNLGGIDFQSFLPDLRQLPRNTHAVVTAVVSAQALEGYDIKLTVDVCPYSEVILEPEFGL